MDEEIQLVSEKDQPKPMRLRRIEVWVEDKGETLVLVTNHPRLAKPRPVAWNRRLCER